jgi:hypothetical protein
VRIRSTTAVATLPTIVRAVSCQLAARACARRRIMIEPGTPTTPPDELPTEIPPDVPEADALEQSRDVPIDDEDAFDEYEPDRP